MTNQTPHKLSRRDALKILGAVAGASVLANIPSKWTKPELAAGVLPAHAQTSVGHTILAAASGLDNGNFCQPQLFTATITPPTPGIPLHYVITPNTSGTITSPALTGNINTDASGSATLTIIISGNFNVGDTIMATWSFVNASDGIGSSSATITNTSGGC